ncbi:DNA methylase [Microbacterium sp. SA39]|nr:DNA methylase [Microbacterium sp. SA39]
MNSVPPDSATSLLDEAALPLVALAELARREAHRPRPVYLAHKWFARRFGTAMRALLVGSQTSTEKEFWATFEKGGPLTGATVADLFIGGGTSLYEASRLGAHVVGADIDPVACAVTEFELTAHRYPNPWDAFDEVNNALNDQQSLYSTVGPDGDARIGLHYFWVQEVTCARCDLTFDAHPHHRVALDGDGQVVFCRACGDIHRVGGDVTTLDCACGERTALAEGTVQRGVATCPACQHSEALIEHARRTGERPTFRLFAIESIAAGSSSTRAVPIRDRVIHRPSDLDFKNLATAQADLADERALLPMRAIPHLGRSDNRLTAYGYTSYTQLFNNRQLLHANRLLAVIGSLPEEHRLPYALAFSNHLTSNCTLTRYTERWRQVTPLFSLRAFAHSTRPVELNPWLRGTGRGTFPNALRKVANAISYAKAPREYSKTGFVDSPLPDGDRTVHIYNDDSRALIQIPDASVDIVLTDPPYLDNIDYSELADFFVPWLAAAGAITDPGGPSAASLATKGRGADHAPLFQAGLRDCFREAARILKPGGRLIFTFQHKAPGAWSALGGALRETGLRYVTVFPLRGDSEMSLHRHQGSSVWDAVFVLAKDDAEPVRRDAIRSSSVLDTVRAEASRWAKTLQLADPDTANLRRALAVAAFLDDDEPTDDEVITLEHAVADVS